VWEFARNNAAGVRFALYLQWLADRPLGSAAGAMRGDGLAFGLCRDLAVGAAPDGAEAWANQASLARGVSIGAPPDPFAALGQVWNLPPPLPEAQAEDGYAAFRALIHANVRHARVAHRPSWDWRDSSGCRTAHQARKAPVRYPLDDLLGVLALESHRARCTIIGEDLGTVPEGFRERLGGADVLLPAAVVPARRRVSPAVTIPGQSGCLRLDPRPAHVRRMVERSRHR
jgi:glycogen operon protein